jgi:hypothetical protein
MRIFVTLLKVIIGLAIAIPAGILVLALTVGVVGTLLGLAIAALKLAVIGLAGYGLFRVARFFLKPARKPAPIRELPPVDPYYEAAMRDLDAEIDGVRRSS